VDETLARSAAPATPHRSIAQVAVESGHPSAEYGTAIPAEDSNFARVRREHLRDTAFSVVRLAPRW
jgi:hypothetical protein